MPISIWNSLLGSSQFHMNIWNSLIGSAKFHMKFPNWKYPISYEIDSLEVPSFIWIIEFPFYEFLIWKCKCSSTFLIWKCPISYEHLKFPDWKRQISYEFPCLEAPNFIWISLLWNSRFHMSIWNRLIRTAQNGWPAKSAPWPGKSAPWPGKSAP